MLTNPARSDDNGASLWITDDASPPDWIDDAAYLVRWGCFVPTAIILWACIGLIAYLLFNLD